MTERGLGKTRWFIDEVSGDLRIRVQNDPGWETTVERAEALPHVLPLNLPAMLQSAYKLGLREQAEYINRALKGV